MSCIFSQEGLLDLSEVVISLWFRAPQASVDAAKADLGYDPQTMIGGAVIPLLVFGEVESGVTGTTGVGGSSGESKFHIGHLDYSGDFIEDYPTTTTSTGFYDTTTGFGNEPIRLPPSYIGIDCSGSDPVISVNLQTTARAVRTGRYFNESGGVTSTDIYAVSAVYGDPSLGSTPPPAFMREQNWSSIGNDVTDYVLSGRPETFIGRSTVPVAPDAWHHLLLSFRLSGTVGNGYSDCRMWMALDDVNCTGGQLPAVTSGRSGSNTIFTSEGLAVDEPAPPPPTYPSGWYAAGQIGDPPVNLYVWIDTVVTGEFTPITYRLHVPHLKGGPLSIPAPDSAVKKIQMAELQIFTGVTLDTSDTAKRRAFINSKGQPVDEAYAVAKFRGIYGPESPIVTPAAPYRLFGKMPDISLTRACGVWIGGSNLGTAEMHFKTIGKIHPVYPDPVLGK